jgi:hypothetical protein
VNTATRHREKAPDTAEKRAPKPRWRPRAPKVGRTRHNRLLWTTVGLVLLLGGIALAGASRGWFTADPNTTLVPQTVQHRWSGWGWWAFGVAFAAALIVAILGLLMLRAQLRRRGGAQLPDPVLERPAGRLQVSMSALSQALSQDLQTHPQVRRAGVNLTGRIRRPEVYLRLTVTPMADIGDVRSHVDAALTRFETTSGWRPEVREVTVGLVGATPQRVRVH